jgi:hypothetical protein
MQDSMIFVIFLRGWEIHSIPIPTGGYAPSIRGLSRRGGRRGSGGLRPGGSDRRQRSAAAQPKRWTGNLNHHPNRTLITPGAKTRGRSRGERLSRKRDGFAGSARSKHDEVPVTPVNGNSSPRRLPEDVDCRRSTAPPRGTAGTRTQALSSNGPFEFLTRT